LALLFLITNTTLIATIEITQHARIPTPTPAEIIAIVLVLLPDPCPDPVSRRRGYVPEAKTLGLGGLVELGLTPEVRGEGNPVAKGIEVELK